jgi:hypothetical protein
MRKKHKMVKLLARCEKCSRIKVLCDDDKEYWQDSICEFPTLPAEVCWSHKNDKENTKIL